MLARDRGQQIRRVRARRQHVLERLDGLLHGAAAGVAAVAAILRVHKLPEPVQPLDQQLAGGCGERVLLDGQVVLAGKLLHHLTRPRLRALGYRDTCLYLHLIDHVPRTQVRGALGVVQVDGLAGVHELHALALHE